MSETVQARPETYVTVGDVMARALVWHGALMSVLGLLSGFTTMFAAAPRAALSAHTIGVLQGAVLFALAGAWHLLDTSPRSRRAIKWTLLVGFYANWLGAQLAGLWSAARNMFIAQHAAEMPEGASPWMNLTTSVLLNTSMLILVSGALLLWSSRRRARG